MFGQFRRLFSSIPFLTRSPNNTPGVPQSQVQVESEPISSRSSSRSSSSAKLPTIKDSEKVNVNDNRFEINSSDNETVSDSKLDDVVKNQCDNKFNGTTSDSDADLAQTNSNFLDAITNLKLDNSSEVSDNHCQEKYYIPDCEAFGHRLSENILRDDDDQQYKCQRVTVLSKERQGIYAQLDPMNFSSSASNGNEVIYSLACSDVYDDIGNGEISKEFFVKVTNQDYDNFTLIISDDYFRECQISSESHPVSEFVEYRFADYSNWQITQVSKESMLSFMETKFAEWKNQILNPSCEAAFSRLLQQGLVTKVFDKNIFNTPEELKSKYQVVNVNTVTNTSTIIINLPHPVSELRVWNIMKNEYEYMDPRLPGAPQNDDEEKEYWNGMVEEFKKDRGEEYIERLLEGKRSEGQC